MNRIEHFRTYARNLFSVLEDKYQYKFEEEKVFRYADIDWSVQLLYINELKNLKIEIEQAPYYTDYGLTFSVQNLENKEEVIIYNLPHERQDLENKFLEVAYELIFSDEDSIDLISGKEWRSYNKILIRK